MEPTLLCCVMQLPATNFETFTAIGHALSDVFVNF